MSDNQDNQATDNNAQAGLDELQEGAVAGGAKSNIDVLKDVPVTLAVEVGRTKVSIRDLLNLHHGSVVKLSRQVGESLDVCVNGVLIARGDVVVANESLGIRLTEVMSPEKRAEMIK